MTLPAFVTAEFVAAFVACAMVGYLAWLQSRREAREARGEVEPRHIPSVDAKIEARVATTEERFGRELNHLHGRVSNLRDEIRGELKGTTEKVEAAAQKMQDTYAATVEKIGSVTATVEQLNQRQHNSERKLDNHIANHPKHS